MVKRWNIVTQQYDEELPPGPLTEAEKKPNPLVRIVVGTLIGLTLAAGIVFVAKTSHTPSPDERATALTALVAPDVVKVVAGQDPDQSINDRIRAEITAFEKDSDCTLAAGTVALGNTAKVAAARAENLISQARAATAQDTANEYGFGYTVARGVPGVTITGKQAILPAPYAAVVVAIRCPVVASPAAPGFGS